MEKEYNIQDFFDLMEGLRTQRRDMSDHNKMLSRQAEGFIDSPEAEGLELGYDQSSSIPIQHHKSRLQQPFSDYYRREFHVPRGRHPAGRDFIKEMIDSRAVDKWNKYQEDYIKAEELSEKNKDHLAEIGLSSPESKKSYPEEKGFKKTGPNVYQMDPLDIIVEGASAPKLLGEGLGDSVIPPMPDLPVEEKKKKPKKEPIFKHGPAPDMFSAFKGRNLSDLFPSIPKPSNEWGGSIGAGLAALGDAFMAGGGMKSSFLNNIIKTREKRRKEPMEDFKVFQTLLNKEVAERGRRYDRKMERLQRELQRETTFQLGKMTIEERRESNKRMAALKKLILELGQKNKERGFKIQEEGLGVQKKLAKSLIDSRESTISKTMPGSQKVLDLVKSIKGGAGVGTWRKPFLQDILTGRRPPKSLSVEDFNKNMLLQIKPSSKNEEKKKKEEAIWKMYNNPIDRAIIKTQFGKPLEEVTGASFNTPNFRQKFNNDKKRVMKLIEEPNLKKNTAYARRVLTNIKNIFGVIGMTQGEPVVSMEQFLPDVASNALWFSPRNKETGEIDHSQRRKIDLPGVTVPVFGRLTQPADYVASAKSRFGDYDPYSGMGGQAGILNQLWAQVHGPIRHEQFGATQTFTETQDWMRQTGQKSSIAPTNEVVMVKYFWDQAKKLDRDLSRQASNIRLLGGQELIDHFKENKLHIGSMLNDPIVASSNELADWADRKYTDALSKVGSDKFTSADMPFWWQKNREAVLESNAAAVPEEKIYFSKTSGRFDKNPFDRSAQLGWQAPKDWGYRTWNKYIRNYGLKKR